MTSIVETSPCALKRPTPSCTFRSPTPVSLNTWHVVRVRRKKRRGVLQLDKGPKVTGRAHGRLLELNLNQPLYLGGLRY